MLYDRWREVARARRSELALKDLSDGRSWTFGQLLEAGETRSDPGATWVCPKGNGIEVMLEVVLGWRDQGVVCPLEESDTPPACELPSRGIAHVKRTSATTGAARLITFTGEQLAADCANIIETMGLHPGWPN